MSNPNSVPYFDHNATTPVAPPVAAAFSEALTTCYGNASSIHGLGQLARQTLERARREVASFLQIDSKELVWTSGGTESNNLAIAGLVRQSTRTNKHVVTTTVEHPSVLQTCRMLESEGVSVTYLPVDEQGSVTAQQVADAMRSDTVLVTVMHANNETGTLQPIAEIAQVVQTKRRLGKVASFFHSDGVQVLGKLRLDLPSLGVDLYSLSAHKIYGPKGIGALYVRSGVSLRSLQGGGNHERGRRAGTENVPGAVAFAAAIQSLEDGEPQRLGRLRDHFEVNLRHRLPSLIINGGLAARLPNTSNLRLPFGTGEAAVIALDMQNFAISTGAACSSGSTEPSHVLLAMGLAMDEAKRSIRISFGRNNNQAEVDQLTDALVSLAHRAGVEANSEVAYAS